MNFNHGIIEKNLFINVQSTHQTVGFQQKKLEREQMVSAVYQNAIKGLHMQLGAGMNKRERERKKRYKQKFSNFGVMDVLIHGSNHVPKPGPQALIIDPLYKRKCNGSIASYMLFILLEYVLRSTNKSNPLKFLHCSNTKPAISVHYLMMVVQQEEVYSCRVVALLN